MKHLKSGLAVFLLVLAAVFGIRLCLGGLWGQLDGYWMAQDFTQRFELNLRPKTLTFTMIEDTHGGFHNDGDTLWRIDLNGQRPVVEGDDWHTLPVAEDILRRATVLDEFGERSLLDSAPCLREDGGKWRILHRSTAGEGEEKGWFNWSLCVYDELGGCMYLYECDL